MSMFGKNGVAESGAATETGERAVGRAPAPPNAGVIEAMTRTPKMATSAAMERPFTPFSPAGTMAAGSITISHTARRAEEGGRRSPRREGPASARRPPPEHDGHDHSDCDEDRDEEGDATHKGGRPE